MSRTLADLFDASEIDRFCDIQNSCGIQLNFRLSSPPFAAPKSNIQNPSAVTTSSATVFNNAVNEDEFIRQSLFSFPSSNVGYATREFNKETSIINMLTFQWDTVNGKTRKIGDILKCSVMGTAWNHGTADEVTPGWENTAPMIQIRQAAGNYTTLYYADDAWDDANQVCVEGWAYADGSLAEVEVALGQGCWYESATENATFTVAGGIAGTETAVGGDTSVILMAGGAFPVAFDPSDAKKVTWTCTPGTAWNHGTADDVTPGWENSAPMIQIRQAAGNYTTLYYADDAWDDANQVCVPGWAYADGSLASVTIDVGGGFWMQNPNDNGQMFLTVKDPTK